MATTTYPFTTAGNYTLSDATKIEITGGVLQLRDQRESFADGNATFYANFTTDEDAAWGDGSLTGTLGNGATVSAGALDLTGASNKYATFPAAGNIDTAVTTGCIRFTYIPNYTGSPASNTHILTVCKSAVDRSNMIEIYHSTGGGITVNQRDSADSTFGSGNLGTLSAVDGTPVEIEFNWDLTPGSEATRLFVGGASTTVRTSSGTRDSNIGNFAIGTDYNLSAISDAKFDDIVVFDTVQHTADYTPGATIPQTVYATDNPYADVNSTFVSSDMTSFTSSSSETGSDLVKFAPKAASQYRYVTGGAAADSDGTYSQSSIATDINAVIADILETRATTGLRCFLHSDDGTTTPTLTLVTIVYNTALSAASEPTLLRLEGFIYCTGADCPDSDVSIRPYRRGFINEGVFHKYSFETLDTSNADGWFGGDIFLQPAGEYWEIKIGSQRYKFQLPSVAAGTIVDLSTLTLDLVED